MYSQCICKIDEINKKYSSNDRAYERRGTIPEAQNKILEKDKLVHDFTCFFSLEISE
jgi:hypothetical protein